METRPRRDAKETTKADAPTVVKFFTISNSIPVPGPDSGLIGIQVVGGVRNGDFKGSKCFEIPTDHGHFAVRQIIDAEFQQAVHLVKAPG